MPPWQPPPRGGSGDRRVQAPTACGAAVGVLAPCPAPMPPQAGGTHTAWLLAPASRGPVPWHRTVTSPRGQGLRAVPPAQPQPRAAAPAGCERCPVGSRAPLPPRPPAAPQLPAPPCSAALAGPGCSRSAAERRCGSPRLSDVCRARAGTREGRGRRRGARRGQPAGRAAAARSEVRARLCRSRDPPGAVAAAGGVSGHRGLGLAFSGSLERVRGLRLGQDRALGAACQVPAGGPGTRPPPCCWGFPAAGSFGCSGPRASQCGTGDPSGLVRGDRR